MANRILLVEDDSSTADYIANGLREEGFLVDRAANGRDGLFHATDGSYDCIILDRMLPGMDGMAVLAAVRAAGIATPVMILSAMSSPEASPNGPNEIPHDPRHLGVPSGASKTISEPMVRLAQTVHLSYINTNTISK